MNLLLDTSVLGAVCHPRKHLDVRTWLARAVLQHEVLISEIADYELRRELVRIDARRSLARLDELAREFRYVPVTTATWRRAATLWAAQRKRGKPTDASTGLDGDVLVAAQALGEEAVVVTENVKHFEGIVSAMVWRDLSVGMDEEPPID